MSSKVLLKRERILILNRITDVLHYTMLLLMVCNWKCLYLMKMHTYKNDLNWIPGNLEVTKYLIEHGADVNAAGNNRGNTPLHYSSENGNWIFDIWKRNLRVKLIKMNWIGIQDTWNWSNIWLIVEQISVLKACPAIW